MAEASYKRPGRIASLTNRLLGSVTKLGVSPAGAQLLAVRGRTSGEVRTNPVNPLEVEGATYLVSPRGNSHWVRNLRAAGEGELRVGRRSRSFTAREIPDADKLPVLKAYLDKWAWEVGAFFDLEKDPSDEQIQRDRSGAPRVRAEPQLARRSIETE